MQYIDVNHPKIIKARDNHIDELVPIIFDKATNSTNTLIRNFLTKSNIELILKSSPRKLYQCQLAFLRYAFPGANGSTGAAYKDWLDFVAITKTRGFTTEEENLRSKFIDSYNEIKKIFNYKNFSEKKVKLYCAYDLAEILDIPTCVYCNRIYTKTVIKRNKEKIIRPTFDHWFSQSKYPLLALSFYNLIPSCTVCNSGVKGAGTFDLSTHFHPYYKNPDKEINYTFSYNYRAYNKYSFKINTNDDFSKRSVEAFELESIYKAHEDELEDLRKIKDAYSEDYIEMLESKVLGGITLNREDVYRLAFGVHLEEAKFDRRPLSKMKKDILIELGIIKSK